LSIINRFEGLASLSYMTEEFELYAPDPESNEVIVVYRGEESYSLPHLNVRDSEEVETEHKGQAWNGYEHETSYTYYNEPQPELEEPEEQPAEEEDEEISEQRPEYMEYFSSREENRLTLFLGGTLLGLLTMYFLLFILGPYILLVP